MSKAVLIILLLLLSLTASLILVFRPAIFLNRAAGSNQNSAVLENSYAFVSPLQAKADGKEQIRLTVFILDNRGLGVANQKVSLSSNPAVSIKDIQSATDDSGRAVFDLSSVISGHYQINLRSDQKPIPQKVRAVFY